MDVGQWFIDLVRVETGLYNLLEDRLRAEHGITAGQYQFLRVIAATDNCRVLDLVREIGISVGATSKAVDRIEAAGWCRRSPNPHDRRSSYLTLTEAGERMLASATPVWTRTISEHLAGVVSEDAVARSGELLATLRASLEERQRVPED